MCPTLPDDIVEAPFKLSRFTVMGRIVLARLFQRILGELGMGRFISYSGRVSHRAMVFDDLLDTILKAYTIYLGLPLILNFAGDAIYQSSVLRSYFEQWEMTKVYFRTMEALRWKKPENSSWANYRDLIFDCLGFSRILYQLFNPRESLLNVERYKHCRLLETQDEQKLSDFSLALSIPSKLKPTTGHDAFFLISPEGVPAASPFMGIEVTILFAYIFLLHVYRKAVDVQMDREKIPAWIKYQSTRIKDNAGFADKIYFDNHGLLKVRIPQTGQFPHLATLDTYSLKMYLDLSKLPCQLVILEPWTLESNEPPEYFMKFMETWTYETPEPPEMSMLFAESWTYESPEPPEMELVFEEKWTEEVPPLEQVFFEPWTYHTKEMVLKYKELWSS